MTLARSLAAQETVKSRYNQLTAEQAFAPYEDRLVVQWFLAGKHPGWWQWAHKNPKPVAEIATQRERRFPSWLEFRRHVDNMDGLPGT